MHLLKGEANIPPRLYLALKGEASIPTAPLFLEENGNRCRISLVTPLQLHPSSLPVLQKHFKHTGPLDQRFEWVSAGAIPTAATSAGRAEATEQQAYKSVRQPPRSPARQGGRRKQSETLRHPCVEQLIVAMANTSSRTPGSLTGASAPSHGLQAACRCSLSSFILFFLLSKQSSLKCTYSPNMYTAGCER